MNKSSLLWSDHSSLSSSSSSLSSDHNYWPLEVANSFPHTNELPRSSAISSYPPNFSYQLRSFLQNWTHFGSFCKLKEEIDSRNLDKVQADGSKIELESLCGAMDSWSLASSPSSYYSRDELFVKDLLVVEIKVEVCQKQPLWASEFSFLVH